MGLMKQLLPLAALLIVVSPQLTFADVTLAFTDSGNFSSGDHLVIGSGGSVIAKGGSVTGTESWNGNAITFTGTIGGYKIDGVSASQAEDEDYVTVNSVRDITAPVGSNLEILVSANVLFNSDPVLGFLWVSPQIWETERWVKVLTGITQTAYSALQTIDTLRPIHGTGVFTAVGVGGGLLTYPYSLTQVISFGGGVGSLFGGSASVVAQVPEPTSVILLGT